MKFLVKTLLLSFLITTSVVINANDQTLRVSEKTEKCLKFLFAEDAGDLRPKEIKQIISLLYRRYSEDLNTIKQNFLHKASVVRLDLTDQLENEILKMNSTASSDAEIYQKALFKKYDLDEKIEKVDKFTNVTKDYIEELRKGDKN